jgi:hypothetical protein
MSGSGAKRLKYKSRGCVKNLHGIDKTTRFPQENKSKSYVSQTIADLIALDLLAI